MGARRRVLGAVVAFALVFVAVPASAQLWRGAPAGQALGIGVNAGFPDGYDTYGAEVFKGLGQLEVGAEYTLLKGDDDSEHVFGGNVGFKAIEAQDGLIAAGPVAGVAYNSFDNGSSIQVPIGVSVLARVPAGSGISIQPYAVPGLYWTRVSFDVPGGDSESDSNSDFGFRAGANVVIENIVFGGSYQKVGDFDGIFSVNAAYFIGNR